MHEPHSNGPPHPVGTYIFLHVRDQACGWAQCHGPQCLCGQHKSASQSVKRTIIAQWQSKCGGHMSHQAPTNVSATALVYWQVCRPVAATSLRVHHMLRQTCCSHELEGASHAQAHVCHRRMKKHVCNRRLALSSENALPSSGASRSAGCVTKWTCPTRS